MDPPARPRRHAGPHRGVLERPPVDAQPAEARSTLDQGLALGRDELKQRVETRHGHDVPALADRWADAWRSDDPEDLASLFTEDAVYTDNGVGKVSHGRDGVATWQAGTHQLIAGAGVKVLDAFRSGNRVLVQSTYSGQVAGAPKPFSLPMATVLTLRGDSIVTDTDYYDLSDLLSQSGLPPTWTPPAG